MIADERYNLVRVKVERSKELICDLEAEIQAYFMTNPYVIGTKRNPETRQLVYYLVSLKPMPFKIAAIIGDMINNLRASLDHLAYQLVIVGGGTPTKNTYFPISEDAAKYKTDSPGKVKGMRQDAIDAITAAKPYKGGNETLWLIHRLNNIDKHRTILTVFSQYAVDLGGLILRDMRRQLSSDPEFASIVAAIDNPPPVFFQEVGENVFPLKEGDEIFIESPDVEWDKNLQFRFEIAFNETGVIESKPVLVTLKSMLDVVDNLIVDFKAFLV
jgi:hypothetical protein